MENKITRKRVDMMSNIGENTEKEQSNKENGRDDEPIIPAVQSSPMLPLLFSDHGCNTHTLLSHNLISQLLRS